MAKKKQTSFKTFESFTEHAQHLRIAHNMMDSAAWKELDPYDVVVYLEFKRRYNGKKDNESDISLTYEEMKKKMDKERFKKSIDRLIEVGFIDLVKHRAQQRKATIYGLSNRWRYYGTQLFEEGKKRAKLSRRSSMETAGKK